MRWKSKYIDGLLTYLLSEKTDMSTIIGNIVYALNPKFLNEDTFTVPLIGYSEG